MSVNKDSGEKQTSLPSNVRSQGRWASFKPGIPILPYLGARSLGAEQYRNLALKIAKGAPPKRNQGFVLAVTSPESGSGKTLTSLNLAIAMARKGEQKTLLIESDFWSPSLQHQIITSVSPVGLSDLLLNRNVESLADAVVSVWGAGVDLLLAGEGEQIEDLVTGERLEFIVNSARSMYQTIVIDCPPYPLAVSRAVIEQSDQVLAVARADQTRRDALEAMLADLEPEQVAGLVLNDQRDPKHIYASYDSYASYTGSSKASRPEQERPRKMTRRTKTVVFGLVLPLLALTAIGGFGYWWMGVKGRELSDIAQLPSSAFTDRQALEEETLAAVGGTASDLVNVGIPTVTMQTEEVGTLPPAMMEIDTELLSSVRTKADHSPSFTALVSAEGRIVDVTEIEDAVLSTESRSMLVEALKGADFSPAMKNGMPVSAWVEITFPPGKSETTS